MVHAPPAAVRKNRQRKAPEHASTRERDLGVGVGERDSATVAMDRSMCVPAHLSPPRPRAAVAGAAPSPLLSPPIFAAAGGGAGAHPPDGHTTHQSIYNQSVALPATTTPLYSTGKFTRVSLVAVRVSCVTLYILRPVVILPYPQNQRPHHLFSLTTVTPITVSCVPKNTLVITIDIIY